MTLLLLLLTLLPPVARGQNFGQTQFSGLLEGLFVHWPLDGSLEDVLSGGIGTARGGEIEFVSGAEGSGFGEAVQLRGGEYIEDSSNPSVLRGEGLSVSLWFRIDAASPGQTLFSKGRSDPWRISESDNHGIEFKYGSQIIGTDALEPGLHFLVVVEDADEKEVQLWVDSNFEAAAAVDVTRVFQISPIVIGGQRDGAGEKWRGLIDDVAIWNRALSEEDVKKIWADGNGRVLGLEDFDGDGLLDIAEHRAGTNPSSTDTDGDGLGDNVESGAGIWISELDTGTNPLIADSDGDGLPDGAENPQVASASRPPSDPNKSDTDGDGVPDFNESLVVEDPHFRISAVTMSGGDRLKLSVPSASYTYYVLFQSDSPTFEGGGDPVAGAIGNNGMLDFYPARVTRGVRYYRVGRFVPPVDLDEDGVDDFSEELDGVSTSPLNPASTVKLADGAQSIPDLSTLLSMSVDVSFDDENLANTQFVVKFVVANPDDGARELYFLNTQRHSSHQRFARATGLECLEKFPCINGEFSYFPKVKLGAERNGLFAIKFDANLPSEDAIAVFDLVAANLGVAQGNLAVRIKNLGDESIGELRAVGIQVLTDREIGTDEVSYRGLHEAYAFGRLRVVEPGQRPSLQDIAIFKTIPNDVPHIAGTITEQEQTPLSHVNLRAIQNDSPNAFIRDASISDRIAPLIGEFVYFRVRHEGYEIQKANQAEVDAFFADLRPLTMQVPPRDLTFTKIARLSEIGFDSAKGFGVKSANLAEMRKISGMSTVVPDGFAIPFYFYDAFMKHNGFYAMAAEMMAEPSFIESVDVRDAALDAFRKAIRKGEMPQWMLDALAEVQGQFSGDSIRCRSSTNNEDLPNFNGAGLYDSYTHHQPEEGHLSKSIRQVYASLWNLRAFDEREFYRIDHFAAAMGVLLHRNFEDEDANGVAVSKNILFGAEDEPSAGIYYVNAQFGENLVTNPEGQAIPEQSLVSASNLPVYLSYSNLDGGRDRVLNSLHARNLANKLEQIHEHFKLLYDGDKNFAIEIEFKITAEHELAIKQARPWLN